jgi:hypothetical protein
MQTDTKNAAAVALGRMARGIKKTLSPAQRQQRAQQAAQARYALAQKRLAQVKPLRAELPEPEKPFTIQNA